MRTRVRTRLLFARAAVPPLVLRGLQILQEQLDSGGHGGKCVSLQQLFTGNTLLKTKPKPHSALCLLCLSWASLTTGRPFQSGRPSACCCAGTLCSGRLLQPTGCLHTSGPHLSSFSQPNMENNVPYYVNIVKKVGTHKHTGILSETTGRSSLIPLKPP